MRGRGRCSLRSLGEEYGRAVFSEYRAAGAAAGCFMLRRGRWKAVHYVGFGPELFDPEERTDLAGTEPEIVAELMEAVDARAKSAQAALVDGHGGRNAVLRAGAFSETSAPDDKPVFV